MCFRWKLVIRRGGWAIFDLDNDMDTFYTSELKKVGGERDGLLQFPTSQARLAATKVMDICHTP
jgi:hypothetical protein